MAIWHGAAMQGMMLVKLTNVTVCEIEVRSDYIEVRSDMI